MTRRTDVSAAGVGHVTSGQRRVLYDGWYPMDKALQRVSQLCNNSNILFLQKQFERLQRMPGANRIFARIASSSDRDQLEDYLAEARYALVCAGLGFQVDVEPFGSKGPDLGLSRDGRRAIVEIMRFRKIYLGPPQLESSDENLRLSEYGSPPRDIRKAFEKLLAKFPQVEGEQAIIAIWNDDGDLEELEVRAAVNDLCEDADWGIRSLPPGLLFVLYGSPWVRAQNQQQLYCFPLRHPDQLDYMTWQHEFEEYTVRESVQRALAQHSGEG